MGSEMCIRDSPWGVCCSYCNEYAQEDKPFEVPIHLVGDPGRNSLLWLPHIVVYLGDETPGYGFHDFTQIQSWNAVKLTEKCISPYTIDRIV